MYCSIYWALKSPSSTIPVCIISKLPANRFGATGSSEIWFLKKKKKGALKTKWLAILSVTKLLNAPFLKIRNINNVGLHFHIHVETLWRGRNVFPYSHDMVSRKLCFLFSFSHSASATKTFQNLSGSCYCSLCPSAISMVSFLQVLGSGRKSFLFLWAFLSLSASSDC